MPDEMADEVTWHDVGAVEDFRGERPTPVQAGRQGVLVTRCQGEFYATAALCPHKFAPLEAGTVEPGCMLACPLHDAHFNLRTGDPREGDGWAGRLPTHAVQVVDGRVLVATS